MRVQFHHSCSFSDNFEPHRRVISCDNDLLALDLLSKSTSVSDSRVLSAFSVSRPVGCVRASVLSGVSARCVCCGGSLDGSDVSWCRVCAEDACGGMANSGSDHIDRNSWKHGPEVSGGTKALIQCSGTTDRRSFVDTVVGGAALAQYLRGAPEGTKVEAWEGRIFTCSRPVSWDVSVAEGCKVTVSAVYLPKKRPGPPAARPLYRILFGWSRLLYTASSGIWIFRGALRGSQVLPALVSCFDWAVRGTYRTAWAVQPCCRCSYSYGNGPAVGPQVSGNWEFLRGLWRAVAP